jgi:hypothetical protein
MSGVIHIAIAYAFAVALYALWVRECGPKSEKPRSTGAEGRPTPRTSGDQSSIKQ